MGFKTDLQLLEMLELLVSSPVQAGQGCSQVDGITGWSDHLEKCYLQ